MKCLVTDHIPRSKGQGSCHREWEMTARRTAHLHLRVRRLALAVVNDGNPRLPCSSRTAATIRGHEEHTRMANRIVFAVVDKSTNRPQGHLPQLIHLPCRTITARKPPPGRQDAHRPEVPGPRGLVLLLQRPVWRAVSGQPSSHTKPALMKRGLCSCSPRNCDTGPSQRVSDPGGRGEGG